MSTTLGRLKTPRMMVAGVALVLAACGGDRDVSPPAPASTAVDGPLVFTAPWQGRWHVEVTFRDCESDRLLVVEDVVGSLCEGDTLALGPFPEVFRGSVGSDQVRVDGSRDIAIDGCALRFSIHLELNRDWPGAAVTGEGTLLTSVGPGCESIAQPRCGRYEVMATRIASSDGYCDSLAAGTLPDNARGARRFLRATMPSRGTP